MIKTKRVYDKPSDDDGYRILLIPVSIVKAVVDLISLDKKVIELRDLVKPTKK